MTIDHQTRLSKLQEHLRQQNIDIGMITTPANVFYYTGFHSDPHERFMALIIDNQNGETTLFVPALDKEIAEDASAVKNIVTVSDEEDPYAKLKQKITGKVSLFCTGNENSKHVPASAVAIILP
ncbi:aminopeptidase P family N-terminal domain-containing protein [Virgibacillus halophilus]|uniref:Aminopeptidase P family N-terminal domain-containing protein n=1 Tax=Tigheibacillus halophilus TaxID=361280 RepID=A0ABU5C2A3_9BACI|nr:aminopeptidase P family N-terminal domain-containing protein [Virgibacillus halophilus]